MGKAGAFLEIARQGSSYRPVAERVGDFQTVEIPLAGDVLNAQAARCMECGTPFCHGYGCPLGNVVPELNDLAWQGRWAEALDLLLSTNPLPEFTGRLCPAPCEAACVLAVNDGAVTIRQVELAIIEKAFAAGRLRPAPPARTGLKAAIVGSGPAGLAAAATLNRAGCEVVVYERASRCGGLLRYGIPDFKLEKRVIDRRLALMRQEGIRFETGVSVGKDVSYHFLRDRFDALCLCGGTPEARDLAVPGRELKGICFALDYLAAQNRKLSGECAAGDADLHAGGKRVVIVGGGDTGADCLGTAIRQGARRVLQLEIMPEPPRERPESTPWPEWPLIRRDASSHQEGGERRWGVATTAFLGQAGRVSGVRCVEVAAGRRADGAPGFTPRPGTEFEAGADLVLLALGYAPAGRGRLADDLGLACDAGGKLRLDGRHMTSAPGIFAAGDMRIGPSLVARAIADGAAAARDIAAAFADGPARGGPAPGGPGGAGR